MTASSAAIITNQDPFTTEVYASREDWKKARPSFIGASEAGAIFGVSPFASPLSVFTDKIGAADESASSPIMQLGNALEPHIAERYEHETGHKLRDLGKWTVLRSRQYPFIACTLDRVIEAPDRADPGDLEMKAPLFLDDWNDGVPLHYQVQGEQQLFVTGWQWGAFAALARSTGELRRYPLERHEVFIGELVERLREFWERTQRGEAPPADASEATAAALQRLFPRNTPAVEVALPGDLEDLDAQRLAAIEAIKQAEEKKREAENRIKAAIGDATTGRLPSGIAYSWALVERKEHTVKASSSRVLTRRKAPKGK